MIDTPPPPFPSFGPFVGPPKENESPGAKTKKLKATYQPSFVAIELGLYGKNPGKGATQTGIGLRPLPGKAPVEPNVNLLQTGKGKGFAFKNLLK